MNKIKIQTEQEYRQYANFIVSNLHKVTSGLKVVLGPGLSMTFNEIVDVDKSTAILVFWSMLKQSNLTLYIFESNDAIISFAVMEDSRLLRYFYVCSLKQKQGFGSEIISMFKQEGDLRVRIEDREYKKGLNRFYEKNGFTFLKKNKVMGVMYHEYICFVNNGVEILPK